MWGARTGNSDNKSWVRTILGSALEWRQLYPNANGGTGNSWPLIVTVSIHGNWWLEMAQTEPASGWARSFLPSHRKVSRTLLPHQSKTKNTKFPRFFGSKHHCASLSRWLALSCGTLSKSTRKRIEILFLLLFSQNFLIYFICTDPRLESGEPLHLSR